jgi:L-2-hydroxyglutarate oxidase LhgO
VHLTLDLGGQARFGPDVQWVEAPDDLAVHPARGQVFYAEVRKYWPGLRDGALEPGYAGIRPKVFDAQGAAITDFVVQGLPRMACRAWSTCLASSAGAHQRTGPG